MLRSDPTAGFLAMSSSLSFMFVFRLLFAWVGAFFLTLTVTNILDLWSPEWLWSLTFVFIVVGVISTAVSHVRRVRLIASGPVDAALLGNRQRRQIEVPLDAGATFDLVEAALRELPRCTGIEAARDSLQIRAKVERLDAPTSRFSTQYVFFDWLRTKRNRVLATVTPGDGTGSVLLVCEPDSGAWSDWFRVDDGTNLENAEAITRAIARRVAERRRGERETVRETATEKELAVAKLGLLHAQVEPHFLYNTLASAQVLTGTDPAGAGQMLGNLITYLRHSLPRTTDASSTLGLELERTRAYLEILEIRMGPRLRVQVDIPEPLLGLTFPPMMLQTLVENAIKHGLEPKTAGGTIWIRARTDDRSLSVTVADDGEGFGGTSSGTGIGLKNVRERLRLAYGGGAAFQLVANFPEGVAATITVPLPPIPAVAAPATAGTPSSPGGHDHA